MKKLWQRLIFDLGFLCLYFGVDFPEASSIQPTPIHEKLIVDLRTKLFAEEFCLGEKPPEDLDLSFLDHAKNLLELALKEVDKGNYDLAAKEARRALKSLKKHRRLYQAWSRRKRCLIETTPEALRLELRWWGLWHRGGPY